MQDFPPIGKQGALHTERDDQLTNAFIMQHLSRTLCAGKITDRHTGQLGRFMAVGRQQVDPGQQRIADLLPRCRVEDHPGFGSLGGVDHPLNGAEIIFQLHQQNIRCGHRRLAAGHFGSGHRQIGARIDRNHILGIISRHVDQRVTRRFFFTGKQRDGIEATVFQMTAGKVAEIILTDLADIVHPRTRPQGRHRLISPFTARSHHTVVGDQ